MATGTPPRDEGLTGSLRRMARTLLRVLETRLEILSTELAEERGHLTRLVIVVLGVVFCLYAGLTLGVVFVVLAASPENRLAAIGVSALVLLLGAISGLLWLRAWLKRRPAMFATTIAEFRKDRERLGGGPA
jgi:uncharacterized membrane protein YqjE